MCVRACVCVCARACVRACVRWTQCSTDVDMLCAGLSSGVLPASVVSEDTDARAGDVNSRRLRLYRDGGPGRPVRGPC